jgi:hypothetical protein
LKSKLDKVWKFVEESKVLSTHFAYQWREGKNVPSFFERSLPGKNIIIAREKQKRENWKREKGSILKDLFGDSGK